MDVYDGHFDDHDNRYDDDHDMDFIELLEKHSLLLGVGCAALFILTFGIGYSACGLLTAHHAMKQQWGMDGLGVVFLWPVAIYAHEAMKREE